MRYFLAVYTARCSALKLYEMLRARKFNVSTVNTPSSLGIGCGLSVKFQPSDYGYVKNYVQNVKSGFKGFYEVNSNKARRIF